MLLPGGAAAPSAPRQFTVQQDCNVAGLAPSHALSLTRAIIARHDGESTALHVSDCVPPLQPDAHARRLTRPTKYCCFHLRDGEAASANPCLEAKIVALPYCTKGPLAAFHSYAIVHSSSKVTWA
eukprot:scaffold2879_cov269-Prasinococcus_capsulatus_cf.AAC.44